MRRADRLLERLRERSFLGWTFEDVECVLHHLGFAEVARTGSHFTYKHHALAKLYTVPKRTEIKPPYVRDLLNRIKELENQ